MNNSPQLGEAIGTFELRISCRKLVNLDTFSKSDPYVQVLLRDPSTGQLAVIGATERLNDNLNPDFTRAIRVPYLFEVVQQLTFRVLDDDGSVSELIGEASCVLTDIALSQSRSFTAELTLPAGHQQTSKKANKRRGTIYVAGDDVSGPRSQLSMQFSASKLDKKDVFGKSDPFLVFHRVRDNGQMSAVAKTDVIKNTLDPVWRPVILSSNALYGTNEQALVEIQCFDWNKSSPPELIGSVRVPARELLQPGSWELVNQKKAAKKKGYKNSGILQLVNCQVAQMADFLDFLRGGLQMSVVVGIDCTASNGSPGFANSLHYLSPYQPNQYQRAISSVGSVVEPYDSARCFTAFAYGGQATHHTVVNHCFALNFNEHQPQIPNGTMGLLAAYGTQMQYIKLSGPTLFAPIINKSASYAIQSKNQGSHNYIVLLLLTDGVYQDRQDTIDAIVNCSMLPMSIIIIGIGNADFQAMEELDADDKPLISSRGVKMSRDIVQFVPFRDFEQRPLPTLAAEVLRELPEQVEKYFAAVGIAPKPPVNVAPAAMPPPAYDAVASTSTASAPEIDLAAAAATIQLDDASSDDEGAAPHPSRLQHKNTNYPELFH